MKIAIVTGGSSGIGQSAATQLAKRGVGIVVTYRGNEQGARETVAMVEKDGGQAVALPLDVGASDTFPAFREAVSATLRDKWNRDTFDYLVNNAGFGEMAWFEETTEELFDRFTRVLLKGPYFLTQTLLPLQENGGAIVNVTSNSALLHSLAPGYSAYATMKGGLITLTSYLAAELSKRGIRVNGVAPGPTRTRLADNAFERFPEVIPPLVAKTALGRLGEQDDVGDVIAFLLSDEARWVTGQNVEASGGFRLGIPA